MKDKPLKAATAWMAFSAAGHYVPFIGAHYSAKGVRDSYAERFGHSLDRAGYRVSKVRITPVKRKRRAPAPEEKA